MRPTWTLLRTLNPAHFVFKARSQSRRTSAAKRAPAAARPRIEPTPGKGAVVRFRALGFRALGLRALGFARVWVLKDLGFRVFVWFLVGFFWVKGSGLP